MKLVKKYDKYLKVSKEFTFESKNNKFQEITTKQTFSDSILIAQYLKYKKSR